MRASVQIQNHPYLADHRVERRAVYPAVESLEILAQAVAAHYPGQRLLQSRDAQFLRFLQIPADTTSMEAIADIEPEDNTGLTASLGTSIRTPGGAITRILEHARVTFSDISFPVPIPLDVACAGEGICYPLPAEKLYKELVPFGPAFQNAAETVFLFEGGAVAALNAPRIETGSHLLGSPFPLDAAFHVACAWGQRYRSFVAFPVGYTGRKIIRPAEAGAPYYCRVVPTDTQGDDTILFDIWIYNAGGELCEVASGVRMKNIFQRRMRVPEWVKADEHDALRRIRERTSGVSVVELTSILPFAEKILSPHELEIGRRRHPGKRNRHVGARIALKRLARILYKTRLPFDPLSIETIAPDGIHPMCVPSGYKQDFFCSASHDDRFAVAVAGDRPIGVDVERLKDILLKGAHVYMTSNEQALCARSPLGQGQAALRVWTAKECAAKALDIPIVSMWSRAELKEIGNDRSIVSVEGRAVEAVHAGVDDHLFTVLSVPKS